jgi:hypothetical protein
MSSFDMTVSPKRHRLARFAAALAVAAAAFWTGPPLSADSNGADANQMELFIQIGRVPIWMGDRIRYTVDERTRVEARISGVSKELLLVLRIGEQEPGQHTLPWDGTYHGAPFAGRYEFELFFGEEYAARFWFLCKPLTQAA